MKRKNEFENSITHLTCLINKLKTRIDDSDDYNKAYNRLLLQRAELRKKLAESKGSKIVYLFNFLKPKRKEKLISDYF